MMSGVRAKKHVENITISAISRTKVGRICAEVVSVGGRSTIT